MPGIDEGGNKMRIGIHQPEHLGWLGFYNKLFMSDIFVLLDNVQFEKNYFQNRNKIKGSNGAFWLTVPVKDKSSKKLIKDVKIDNHKWKSPYLKSIELAYKKAPYFNDYFPSFSRLFDKDYELLAELNKKIIKYFMRHFRLNTQIIEASKLDVEGNKTKLLLDICKTLNADTYLSGTSGRDYLDLNLFKKENIRVIFQDFHHPMYPQLWKKFVFNLSALDLLFNQGEKSRKYISEKVYKNE